MLRTLAWIILVASGAILIAEARILIGVDFIDPVSSTTNFLMVLAPICFGASIWYLRRLWKISNTVIYPYEDDEYGEGWTVHPND